MSKNETFRKDFIQDEEVNKEVSEAIAKVHEAIEGRYDLTGQDLMELQGLLCEFQHYKPVKQPEESKDVNMMMELCDAQVSQWALDTYGDADNDLNWEKQRAFIAGGIRIRKEISERQIKAVQPQPTNEPTTEGMESNVAPDINVTSKKQKEEEPLQSNTPSGVQSKEQKTAVGTLGEVIEKSNCKVVFGIQDWQIKRIEEERERWNKIDIGSFDIEVDMIYSIHFWEKLAKEFAWQPLTLALHYFKAMEEYRNQGLPSEEEIEKAAWENTKHLTHTTSDKAKFIKGAKWVISKLRS